MRCNVGLAGVAVALTVCGCASLVPEEARQDEPIASSDLTDEQRELVAACNAAQQGQSDYSDLRLIEEVAADASGVRRFRVLASVDLDQDGETEEVEVSARVPADRFDGPLEVAAFECTQPAISG